MRLGIFGKRAEAPGVPAAAKSPAPAKAPAGSASPAPASRADRLESPSTSRPKAALSVEPRSSDEAYLERARSAGPLHPTGDAQSERAEFETLSKQLNGATLPERERINERLIQLAEPLLRAQGARPKAITFEGKPALEIQPQSSGDGLGKAAASLESQFSYRMIYCPGLFTGATLAEALPAQRAVAIGNGNVLRGARDASLAHELVHVENRVDEEQGRARLFHGVGVARDGGSLPGAQELYAQHMSFDEVAAFSTESAVVAEQLREAVEGRGGTPAAERQADAVRLMFDLIATAGTSRGLGERLAKAATAAREKLSPDKSGYVLQSIPAKNGGQDRLAEIDLAGFSVLIPVVDPEAVKLFDAAKGGSSGARRALGEQLASHFDKLAAAGAQQSEGMDAVFQELTSISGPQDAQEHLKRAIDRTLENRRALLELGSEF